MDRNKLIKDMQKLIKDPDKIYKTLKLKFPDLTKNEVYAI